MVSSQNSYETRIGRFQDMIAILQTFPVYQPTNSFITNEALKKFVADVLTKNTEVITQDIFLKNKRDERRLLAFKEANGANLECVQACLDNIAHYVAGEFGTTNTSYKQIYSLKRRIKPTYVKKVVENDAPKRKATRSSSEKSFTGLVGIAKQVVQIITSLGSAYAPQNEAIQLANFTKKTAELDQVNQTIALALQQYSDVVQKRKDLYDGAGSMKSRVIMIRNYMSSFNGGRANPQYMQVVAALKGS